MKEYKCALISCIIYSVVIGSIYATMAVLSLMARVCWFSMDQSPFLYLVFLLYYGRNECRGIIKWENLDVMSDVTVILPDETGLTYRTYIFSLAYVSLHGAMIFFALFAICGINNSCLGRKSFAIFFLPWIFVCCCILGMDLTATTFHIMDMISAMTTDGLMELLEIANSVQARPAFDQLSWMDRFLPPLMMTLTTCKCFILLIFDIIVITLITRAGWAASTYHKYVDETVRHYSSNMSRANPAFEESQNDIVAQKQHNRQMEYINNQTSLESIPRVATAPSEDSTPDRYKDTSTQVFVYPDRNNYKNRNDNRQSEEKQHSIPRPNTLALNTRYNERQQQHQQQQQQNQRPPTQQPSFNDQRQEDREIDSRLSNYTSTNGSVIRSVEPLKDENISERQQQQTRVRVLPMVAELNRNSSDAKQKPIVPPKPINRSSMQPAVVEERRPDSRSTGNKVDRNSSVHAPDELRGQLPWSYFKARDDVPKRAFTSLDENEDLPPVPIPDYTLHFPKTKRSNLNSDSDGENSWSRYDQR